jgi:glycosyltransferase involved in cell wall biosynthesis
MMSVENPPVSDVREPIILHVLEALESGCARHVVDIVRSVDGVRHEVAVPRERVGGVTDREAVASMRDAGAGIHLVDMRRSPLRPENAAALARVRSLIRRLAPDIVHCHSSIGGVIGRLAAVGTTATTVYTPNGLVQGRAATLVERLLGRITDRFVAVSETEGFDVTRRRLVAPEHLVVIPNGISVEPVPPRDLRSLLGVGPVTPLVGTMGRLLPQKAPEVFVRACAAVKQSCPEAHFVLIGDGPLRQVVSDLVEANGLQSSFHWLRELPSAAAYLHDLTVFALASRFEGGPYSPLEAIRADVPVVLSDVVGNRDVIEHRTSGLFVPPDDSALLAEALLELLTDPVAAGALARAAHDRLGAHFDLRVSARQLQNVYLACVMAR